MNMPTPAEFTVYKCAQVWMCRELAGAGHFTNHSSKVWLAWIILRIWNLGRTTLSFLAGCGALQQPQRLVTAVSCLHIGNWDGSELCAGM